MPAAVLVPIIMGREPSLLLTKANSAPGNDTPAEVSFPGGAHRSRRSGCRGCGAARSTRRRFALDPVRVDVVGRMDNYVTGTGYCITPVIGLLPTGLTFVPSPQEVEAVFEFSLLGLAGPCRAARQKQHVRGQWQEYWVWPHPDHFIWGATAAIMHHLAGKLRLRFAENSPAGNAVRGVRGVAAFGAFRRTASNSGSRRHDDGSADGWPSSGLLVTQDASPPTNGYAPARLQNGQVLPAHVVPLSPEKPPRSGKALSAGTLNR